MVIFRLGFILQACARQFADSEKDRDSGLLWRSGLDEFTASQSALAKWLGSWCSGLS
jgi:hypothetical protein